MGNIADSPKNGGDSKLNNKIKKYNISSSFDTKIIDELETTDSLEYLNEGSFSHIYTLKDKYAIKMIKNNSCKNLDSIPEIGILLSLKSDNIINCYGIFKYNDRLCFILDRYNCTLNEYKFKSIDHKFSVINQIISGLKYLHNNFILHLDLTCKNIFINGDEDPKVFIGDFSLSCKTNNLQVYSKNHKISPLYRPYENLKGSFFYSDKSDIWSLGIIIYKILNEKCIFDNCININTNSVYDENMSYIFHIDKLLAWNLWPPKIKGVEFNFEDYLDIDPNKRKRLNNKIEERNKILYNTDVIFNKININIKQKLNNYRYEIDNLYQKMFQKIFIENHEIKVILLSNNELYEFCIMIILSLYDSVDNILQFINIRIIDQLFELLETINFGII